MMNELEQAYFDAAFAAAHPEFAAAQNQPRRVATATPGDIATVTVDTLAGLLKGAVAQTLGLPGDLESLVRMLTGGEQVMPTTEAMQEILPPVVPAGGDPRRMPGVKAAQSVGEFLPVAPIKGAKAAGGVLKSAAQSIRKTPAAMQ